MDGLLHAVEVMYTVTSKPKVFIINTETNDLDKVDASEVVICQILCFAVVF